MFDIKLYELFPLYKSMKNNNKLQEMFVVTYAKVEFSVIFAIDREPYELLLGAIGDHWACVVHLNPGFSACMKDEDYYRLKKILRFCSNKGSFTSFAFLHYIAAHSPSTCGSYAVQPHDLAPYRGKELPEDDQNKVYFYKWNNHQKDHKQAHNFFKTELFMGKEIANFCRTHNVSSCWTDKKVKAKPVTHP